ncbi:MAG: nucleotidyl transferase AbiEii/AbiGii toxin family protein [Chloroflexi bacterium]|nr:nucleotidyl transferase AbiEii/AbiGii toxin family protein [Chloroflexota bacterium]
MKISLEKLEAEAESTGFRPDVLERVAHPLALLGNLDSHPFLRGKLVLKGGTALNLFLFDVPRLSANIDLNYVGSESRDGMLEERPQIEESMRAKFGREDFEVGEAPREHAGGKWHLRYATSSGQRSGIDVDLNYMLRVPLWPITRMDSHSWQGGRRKRYP